MNLFKNIRRAINEAKPLPQVFEKEPEAEFRDKIDATVEQYRATVRGDVIAGVMLWHANRIMNNKQK